MANKGAGRKKLPKNSEANLSGSKRKKRKSGKGAKDSSPEIVEDSSSDDDSGDDSGGDSGAGEDGPPGIPSMAPWTGLLNPSSSSSCRLPLRLLWGGGNRAAKRQNKDEPSYVHAYVPPS